MTNPSPDAVRHHFAGYPFGDPCTEADLARAEAAIGVPIPPVLRTLYRSFNGFRGPTGAAFFWPLFGDSGLVRWHQFLRSEFTQPWLSTCIFYGDAGGGSPWGLKADLPGQVILWDAEWGDDFEIVGTNPLAVWLEEKRKYDELLER